MGIPVAGPFLHRDSAAVSSYFQSPEGHKIELVTYEAYPPGKAKMIGENGVRVHWPSLAHKWPDTPSIQAVASSDAEHRQLDRRVQPDETVRGSDK
jgi:hypothetical protein